MMSMYICFNPKKMKYFINSILFVLFFSCKPAIVENTATYFGGEIVNPRSNFVLLLKDEKVIDTLLLDKKNRFIAEYQSLDEGLYTFKHGLEFQYIYLEPTDSVLVRLNTWDFDESIVFSGKGSSKNEFLINLFLQNEVEEKTMFHYFNLNEELFQTKIDSLTEVRENIYQGYITNELGISEGFQKLSNAAIHFPIYRLKEVYPYYYKNSHQLNEFPEVSEIFYGYRDGINLNETSLLSFYPYQNYVINYLYNISYQQKEKDSTKSNLTINVLNAVIENISSEEIKNTLLKRIVVNDFLKSERTCTIDNEKLAIFLKNCTDEAYITQVQNLVNDSKYVENNKPLPNFDVISYDNKKSNIIDLTKNQKSVIYFWSTEYMSSDYLVSRIKFLEQKHPSILFIGIQMTPEYLNILTEPKLKTLDINKQFKLTDTSFANNFLKSRYPRIIILDNKGLVVNGFTYLDAKNLGQELNKLEIN